MTRLRLGPAITGPAHRIHDGGALLARRYGRWLWPAEAPTIRRLLLRLAGSGVIVYFGSQVIADTNELMFPVTAAGLYSAYRAAPTRPGATARIERRPTGAEADHDQATAEDVYAATLDWTRKLIGDRNGIHLTDLLANAHEHGLLTDLDLASFRASLEDWGVPVRQQLKVGGRNRPGIHRADLPQPPSLDHSPHSGPAASTSPTTAV